MEYKDTVICTVGASLIANATRPDAPIELKQLFDEYQAKNFSMVSQILRNVKDPKEKKWGAEINSVASLIEKGYLTSCQTMYLLVSDTPQGEMTGEILKQYFTVNENGLEFKSVKLIKIEKLNDKKRHEFRLQGLRNLVREMANCVKDNLGRVVINATGGYKATIAYAVLLGQVLNVPVYYLFETFDEIIPLLPLPVSFDPTVYEKYVKIFAALEYSQLIEELHFLRKFSFRSWAEVPSELKIFIDRETIDQKQILSLNPLGQIYIESVEWGCSTIEDEDYFSYKPYQDKITSSGGHAIRFREENRKIIEEIAKLPWVELVSVTGSTEIEGGSSNKVWIEKDHLRVSLSGKAGTGFILVQTTCKSHKFLECVMKRIQSILRGD
ncbi:putative CRISPR-associated protein [Pseudothermotoga sp.]